MHRLKFTPDDLFINRLKTYPEYNVFIYQGRMHVNRENRPLAMHRQSGGLVVYDINRNEGQPGPNRPVRPFVVSGSDKVAFKSQRYQPLVSLHSGDFQWGSAYVSGALGINPTENVALSLNSYSQVLQNATTIQNTPDSIVSSYGEESPITRKLVGTVSTFSANYFNFATATTQQSQVSFAKLTNLTASALQNAARKYTVLSDHFIFTSSSIRSRDLVNPSSPTEKINFIFIPSMYYGSTIKRGSVELNYYITGSKIATCADINHNGTLIGTLGATSGSVVGLVMYDEGVILLTSSVSLEQNSIVYDGSAASNGSWQTYGTTLNDGINPFSATVNNTLASASYDLNFKGVNYINSMTMFAHARKGHLNHSNNPTYRDLEFNRVNDLGAGRFFAEGPSDIANITSGSFVSSSFEKTTYISKVNIYDEAGNLIAITSLAKPVKKTLTDEFTFKMKLDL